MDNAIVSPNDSFRPVTDLYLSVPIDKSRRCIRVIDVQGCSTPFPMDEPLSAATRVIDLDADPKPFFATLSYVWGEPANSNLFTIHLSDGKVKSMLHLTQNCHLALISLRHKLGAFTIWVDAVCINQEEHGEKTHQVNQMGEIYAASNVTYIWIGSDDSHIFVQGIASIGLVSYFFDLSAGTDLTPIRPRLCTAVIIAIWLNPRRYPGVAKWYLTAALKKVWKITPDLIHTPRPLAPGTAWLQRMWTYQEAILAANPVIVCGDVHVSWHLFTAAVSFTLIQARLHELTDRFDVQVAHEWLILALDRETFRETNPGHAAEQVPRSHLLLYQYDSFLNKAFVFCWTLSIICPVLIWVLTCVGLGYLKIDGDKPSFKDIPSPRFSPMNMFLLYCIFCGTFIVLCGILIPCMIFPVTFSWDRIQGCDRKGGLASALCSRICGFSKDYNFATQSVMQSYLHRSMTPLRYDAPEEDVYQDLTANLLEASGYWRLLIAAIRSPAHEGQPSWYVDWSQRKNFSKPDVQVKPRTTSLSLWFSGRQLGPILPENLKVEYSHSTPSILRIYGHGVGTIIHVCRFEKVRAGSPLVRTLDDQGHTNDVSLISSDEDEINLRNLKSFIDLLTKHYKDPRHQAFNGCLMKEVIQYIRGHRNLDERTMLDKLKQKKKSLTRRTSETYWACLQKFFKFMAEHHHCLCSIESSCKCEDCRTELYVIERAGERHSTKKSDVMEGDKLVSFQNMPRLIVLRVEPEQSSESCTRYRLINPACGMWVDDSDYDYVGDRMRACPRAETSNDSFLDIC